MLTAVENEPLNNIKNEDIINVLAAKSQLLTKILMT